MAGLLPANLPMQLWWLLGSLAASCLSVTSYQSGLQAGWLGWLAGLAGRLAGLHILCSRLDLPYRTANSALLSSWRSARYGLRTAYFMYLLGLEIKQANVLISPASPAALRIICPLTAKLSYAKVHTGSTLLHIIQQRSSVKSAVWFVMMVSKVDWVCLIHKRHRGFIPIR